MSESTTAIVRVQKIAFQFSLDGSVTPYLTIFPPLCTPVGEYQKLAVTQPLKEIASIGLGDILTVTLDDSQVSIDLLETGPSPRIDLSRNTCPVCYAPLAPGEVGLGRCINRSCSAQFSFTVVLFLSSLGLSLNYPIKKILDSLLVRRTWNSIWQIFYFRESDIVSPTITQLEAAMFLSYLHSIRSSVTTSQLVDALRIPDLPPAWLDAFRNHVNTERVEISALVNYLDPQKRPQLNCSKPVSTAGWMAWDNFFSLEPNKQLLIGLCQYFTDHF